MVNFSRIVPRHLTVAVLAGLFLVHSINSPALAQPRSFLIFFDKQRSVLTEPAKKTVTFIRESIKRSSRVIIAGHCDTSETDCGKLSLARATVVREELLAQGIAAGVSPTIVSKGTREPRKPTGPNVPEPMNRIVSITVQ